MPIRPLISPSWLTIGRRPAIDIPGAAAFR
jgi:hypothetical protein